MTGSHNGDVRIRSEAIMKAIMAASTYGVQRIVAPQAEIMAKLRSGKQVYVTDAKTQFAFVVDVPNTRLSVAKGSG